MHYRLIEPPSQVDLMLLAPRLPGQFLRQRFLEGWGIPAFIAVKQDASGGAWPRLLALARALGITRCGAIESSFAEETELDHFAEHFTYPLVFRALEIGFEALLDAGYPAELALMELHGSGELGQVLLSAAREGLFPMLASHASPACQAGIAHYWEHALGAESDVQRRAIEVLEEIHSGKFARHLVSEAKQSYPELERWRKDRSKSLEDAERRLQAMLRQAPKAKGI